MYMLITKLYPVSCPPPPAQMHRCTHGNINNIVCTFIRYIYTLSKSILISWMSTEVTGLRTKLQFWNANLLVSFCFVNSIRSNFLKNHLTVYEYESIFKKKYTSNYVHVCIWRISHGFWLDWYGISTILHQQFYDGQWCSFLYEKSLHRKSSKKTHHLLIINRTHFRQFMEEEWKWVLLFQWRHTIISQFRYSSLWCAVFCDKA